MTESTWLISNTWPGVEHGVDGRTWRSHQRLYDVSETNDCKCWQMLWVCHWFTQVCMLNHTLRKCDIGIEAVCCCQHNITWQCVWYIADDNMTFQNLPLLPKHPGIILFYGIFLHQYQGDENNRTTFGAAARLSSELIKPCRSSYNRWRYFWGLRHFSR